MSNTSRRYTLLIMMWVLLATALNGCSSTPVAPSGTPEVEPTAPTASVTQSLFDAPPSTTEVETSVPTASLTPSPSPALTLFPSFTPTITLSPTPNVPLSENGPWLMFLAANAQGGPEYLWTANANGTAVQQLTAEPVRDHAIRPMVGANEQRQIAYVTSSDEAGMSDLTLKIVTFPQKEMLLLVPLTSVNTGYTKGDIIDGYGQKTDIAMALGDLSWSPDGKWLAFVGAQEGASADIYCYSTVTKEIRRLTDGPDQAMLPTWTSDSQYIVHTAASSLIGAGAPYSTGLWEVSPLGGKAVTLLDIGELDSIHSIGRVSPNHFLISSISQGYSGLSLMSVPDGKVSYVGTFEEYSVGDTVLLVYSHMTQPLFDREGWYLVDYSRTITYVSDLGYGYSTWDPVARVFVIDPDEDDAETIAVAPTGQVVAARNEIVYLSPDGQLAAFVPRTPPTDTGLWLRHGNSKPIMVFDETREPPTWLPHGKDSIHYVGWSSDSQVLVFAALSGLYVAHEPDFAPVNISGSLYAPEYYLNWAAWWIS